MRAEISQSTKPRRLARTAGTAFWAIAAFAAAYAVAASYHRGLMREHADSQREKYEHIRIPRLHYGDALPDFALPDLSGRIVRPTDLRGKWLLVAFVGMGCEPCDMHLRDLTQLDTDRLPVVPLAVLRGTSAFGSFAAACGRYAASRQLSLRILVDDGARYSARVCDTDRIPYTVLVDPSGRIRYIQEGRNNDGIASDLGLLMRPRSLGRIPSSPDGPLRMALVGNGSRIPVSSLVRRGTTVLTFVSSSCGACKDRVEVLGRFPSAGGFQNYLVFTSRYEASMAQRKCRRMALRCVSGSMRELARPLHVTWRGVPASVVFRNGRLVYLERSQLTTAELWSVLGSAAAGDPSHGRIVARKAGKGGVP